MQQLQQRQQQQQQQQKQKQPSNPPAEHPTNPPQQQQQPSLLSAQRRALAPRLRDFQPALVGLALQGEVGRVLEVAALLAQLELPGCAFTGKVVSPNVTILPQIGSRHAFSSFLQRHDHKPNRGVWMVRLDGLTQPSQCPALQQPNLIVLR